MATDEAHILSLLRLALTGAAMAILGVAALSGMASASTVAVGYNGAIVTSYDGALWTTQDSGTGAALFDVAWGNPYQWVTVGSGGTVLTSPDGTTWTAQPTGVASWLLGVASSFDGWVAVGTDGTILRSTNGQFWWPQSSGTTNILYDVAYNGFEWMAVGAQGTILSSPNGASWTLLPLPATGTADLFAVRWDGAQWQHTTSSGMASDGTQTQFVSGSLRAITAPCTGLPWVRVGDNGAIQTSPNGITWTNQASGTSENLRGVACIPLPAPPLSCAPASLAVHPGDEVTVTFAGGNAPATWMASGSNAPGPASGPVATVWYPVAGTFAVMANVPATPYFVEESAQCVVTVTEPPALDCSQTAWIVPDGSTVTFAASGGTPPYSWDIPGSNLTGPAAGTALTVLFPAVGTFVATLSDASFNAQSAQCVVTVELGCHNPPMAAFRPAAPEALVQAPLAFEDLTSGSATTWLWDFGDGTISREANPIHSFPSPGRYDVHLSVHGPYCPVTRAWHSVTISPNPLGTPESGPPEHRTPPSSESRGPSPADMNRAPVANAGPIQYAAKGGAVILDGSASADGDGDKLTYSWRQVAGPAAVLETPDLPTLSIAIPPQSQGGVLTFELTVSDGLHLSTDTTIVVVSGQGFAPETGPSSLGPMGDDDPRPVVGHAGGFAIPPWAFWTIGIVSGLLLAWATVLWIATRRNSE